MKTHLKLSTIVLVDKILILSLIINSTSSLGNFFIIMASFHGTKLPRIQQVGLPHIATQAMNAQFQDSWNCH